ncbi:unnamed protein product [Oreochromis niloticus]|nr:unnamed protein product [Mustela putorius furo]
MGHSLLCMMGLLLLSTVIHGNTEVPSKPTVTLQPSWTQIYSGETVTVRCEIQGGEGAQWTYEWRAAKLNTPPTSNEHRIIRATESDSGGYSCRGRRDYFFTEWSDIITLTVSFPNKPTVTLQPSWTQIYSGETVTVRCEIQGGEGAQWTYEWRAAKLNTPPTSNEYRIIRATESDSGGYSCRGRRDYFFTEWSDIITLTVSLSHKEPTVTLQPSWTQIYSDETVTVRCEIQGGEGAQWTYEWRAAKLKIPRIFKELRIIRATESDSGGYSCRSRRHYFFSEWSDIITLTVSYVHSAASLTVSPDRVQHFTSDSVSLTCEGNFTEWRVRKFSEDGRLYSDCRRMTGSTCNINTSKSDTAVYWCESGSEEFSSAVNITVQRQRGDPEESSDYNDVNPNSATALKS